jgi:hypothetical protein
MNCLSQFVYLMVTGSIQNATSVITLGTAQGRFGYQYQPGGAAIQSIP